MDDDLLGLTDPATVLKRRAIGLILGNAGAKPEEPRPKTNQERGFLPALRRSFEHSLDSWLAVLNRRPMPRRPESTAEGLPETAGEIVGNLAHPIDVAAFGAAGLATRAAGLPRLVEAVGERVPGRIASWVAKTATEGAAIGAVGQPVADYAHAKVEETPYGLGDVPRSVALGAVTGAVFDPVLRGAGEVAGRTGRGLRAALFDVDTPLSSELQAYLGVPVDQLIKMGRLFRQEAGSGPKGEKVILYRAPIDKERLLKDRPDTKFYTEQPYVQVDVEQIGLPGDETLHIGTLKSQGLEEIRHRPGRDKQPVNATREVLTVLRGVQHELEANPHLKWVDTEPLNGSVMRHLLQRGARWEGGRRLVISREDFLNGRPQPLTPELEATIADRGGERELVDRAWAARLKMPPDPFGRLARASRKGVDPETLYGGESDIPLDFLDTRHADEHGLGSLQAFDEEGNFFNPRDDDGLLLFSNPVGPAAKEAAGAAGRFVRGFRRGGDGSGRSGDTGGSGAQAELARELYRDPIINTAKMALDPAGQMRVFAAEEKFVPLHGQLKEREDVWEAAAEALAKHIRLGGEEKFNLDEIKQLKGWQLKAREKALVDIDHEINQAINGLDQATTVEAKKRWEVTLDSLSEQREAIVHTLVVGSSQKGRDLRQLRWGLDSVDAWLWRARKAIGIERVLPAEVEEQIRQLAQGIKNARTHQERKAAIAETARAIDALKTRPWWQHLIDLWKTALTTPGPIDVANFTANTTMQLLEEKSMYYSALVDSVLQLWLGGERTATLPVGRGWLQSVERGATNAASEAKGVMTRGYSTSEAAGKFGASVGESFDLLPQSWEKAFKANTMVQTYMKYHWRRFGAADIAFREFALARLINHEARLKAMNEGLTGPAADKRVLEIMAGGAPEVITRAIERAHYMTFTGDNALAEGLNVMRSKLPAYGQAGLQFAIPFVRTVANVADAAIDYTPVVGLLREMAVEGGKGGFDRRAFVEAMGRQLTGATVLSGAFLLAGADLVTGSGPVSKAERDQWDAEGRAPYSFRAVDGTWRSYERILGPGAAIFGLGADLFELSKRMQQYEPGVTTGDKVNKVTRGLAGSIFEMAPGGSMSVFGKHQTSTPEQDFFSNIALNFAAPNIFGMANVAKGLDLYERETDGFLDRVQARVPGLREQLPVKVDATGREVARAEGLVPTLLDPTNPKVAREDPVLIEMRRLGMSFSKPATIDTYLPQQQAIRRAMGLTENVLPERYERTREQIRDISRLAGPSSLAKLAQLMSSPAYATLPDDVKRRVISAVISAERQRGDIVNSLDLLHNNVVP